MPASYNPPGYQYIFQLMPCIPPRSIRGVCADEGYGLAGSIKIHPFYHKGIPNGHYVYPVPFGLLYIENHNIPIVNALVYHAVAGNIHGFQVFRFVGVKKRFLDGQVL